MESGCFQDGRGSLVVTSDGPFEACGASWTGVVDLLEASFGAFWAALEVSCGIFGDGLSVPKAC